ncbi:8931_t:CDS:2 [Cetraspora pellucida]|uniref:8931_t:CDS:1 n=1 Tax=Cetraspora pellucida TaxID=1433469 RepID=A0ACA9MG77_9GLOM|nr:8931_t:CDS:2 [Cetraspora pellucida]
MLANDRNDIILYNNNGYWAGQSFYLHPSSNGLISDTLLSLTIPDMEILAKTVGNLQSSSSDRYEMNCTPGVNSHSVNSNANKSNTNNASREDFSQQNRLLTDKPTDFTFLGPIRSLALFISFGKNVTDKWTAGEFHKIGFHSVFKSFTITDLTKAHEFIIDCAVNCWANIWKIVVIVSSGLDFDVNGFVQKIRKVFDKLTLDVVIIRPVSESNFRSHLKWRIEKDKDKSFVIVVYNKIEIKESFKELLFERCRVQQSIERSPIHFYSKCDPYYEFTNFFPISVIIDDAEWPTTENYFQAQKFEHKWICNKIREAWSAREAFNISRYYDHYKRRDWEDRIPDTGKIFKENVMRTALMAKFGQHERLKYMLLSTGNIPLFEHTKNDLYWGDGGDFGGGQNKLGMILQEVREIYMLEEVQKIASKYGRNYEKWFVDELRELQQFE